jgi:hypothetical protein
MRAAENILLESSDAREVPDLRTARKVHARLRIRSRLRLSTLELALFDYCYLAVRTQRWRGDPSRYVLDLRFVDPATRLVRHIAWRWFGASLLIGVVGILIAWGIGKSPGHWWRHDALPACTVVLAAAICGAVVAAYRTTETVALYTVHGRGCVLEYTGGLGTFHALRAFQPLLLGHLRHSVAARRRSLAEHLRDEMREHSRLRELGVLSEADYEVAKRRVLAAHGNALPSGSGRKAPRPTHRSPGYRAASAAV